MISLSQVLEAMLKPEIGGGTKPFSCIVFPFDERRGVTGQPKYYECVRLKISKPARAAEGAEMSMAKILNHKNPNHWKNQTRNLVFPNGEVRKIHIRDIAYFNNQKVHW